MSFSSVLTALLDANSGYYKLAEASGTTMTDSSGNSHGGTYTGTITLGQTGLISGETDTCALFGGGVGEVAQASWMDQAHAGVGILLTHGATTSRYLIGRFHSGTDQYISIDIGSTTTQLRCYAYINGVQRLISATATNIADGNLHFVYACYDGTTLSLYYDGTLLTSGTWTGSLTASTATLRIGARGDGSETWNAKLEKGWIGPVLTATQVASLWAAASGGGGTSVTVTPPAMTATAAMLVPTITTTRSVTVTPPKMTATAALAVPTITAAKSVIVTPPAMTASSAMLVPAVVTAGDVTIQPPAMAATAALLVPSVSTTRSTTISPPTMAATATMLVPAIVISGAGDVTIDAPAMTAVASLVRPIIITNVSRPVDDNLANAGALTMTGWSTSGYVVDPPSGGTRADIPAVHVEPA